MVNGEVMSDLCTRMNVNACFGMCHFGDDTWNQRNVQHIQFVGYPVIGDSPYDGIAADYFAEAGCCRISVVSCFNVGCQGMTDGRQAADELCCQAGCTFSARLVGTVVQSVVFHSKAESGLNLLGQQSEQFFDVDADVIIDRTAVDGRIAEISRKQNGTCQFHNVMQCFS